MAKYNGHKNWEYWNVSLWVNNDEGLYRMAQHCVRGGRNKTQAATNMLDELNRAGITQTRDGARYTVHNIRAAMRDL